METWVIISELVVDIIGHVAWPVTVMVALFSFLFMFKEQIKEVLGRIRSAKFPGGAEVMFSDLSTAQRDEIAKVVEPDRGSGNWTKAGNIYWLGHDLMWTMDVLLRNAPKQYIVHGLRQSLYHLTAIDLEETRFGTSISQLLDSASKSMESDWTDERREQAATDLRTLTDELGTLATLEQPEKPG